MSKHRWARSWVRSGGRPSEDRWFPAGLGPGTKGWVSLLACWILLTCVVRGQEFTLDGWVVAGGGGQSSGGEFTLDATIGEADTGELAGGDFELSGGFWGVVATVDEAGAPVLGVALHTGDVELWWPADRGVGYVLETATGLANPSSATVWTAVNVTPQTIAGVVSVQVPLTAGSHFFRLRR